MSRYVDRRRGVLSLLLVAAVLVMHAWTGANGAHLPALETSPSTALTAVHHLSAAPQATAAVVGKAAALADSAQHAPGMAMAGSCVAVLLLALTIALPGLASSRVRLRLPARWLRRRPRAVRPPPDLNLRLCVLRT